MSDYSNDAYLARMAIVEAAGQWSRPSVMLRPSIYPDGNQWCALYGESLQEGVAGFGDTPEDAVRDFDKNWYEQKLSAGPSS